VKYAFSEVLFQFGFPTWKLQFLTSHDLVFTSILHQQLNPKYVLLGVPNELAQDEQVYLIFSPLR